MSTVLDSMPGNEETHVPGIGETEEAKKEKDREALLERIDAESAELEKESANIQILHEETEGDRLRTIRQSKLTEINAAHLALQKSLEASDRERQELKEKIQREQDEKRRLEEEKKRLEDEVILLRRNSFVGGSPPLSPAGNSISPTENPVSALSPLPAAAKANENGAPLPGAARKHVQTDSLSKAAVGKDAVEDLAEREAEENGDSRWDRSLGDSPKPFRPFVPSRPPFPPVLSPVSNPLDASSLDGFSKLEGDQDFLSLKGLIASLGKKPNAGKTILTPWESEVRRNVGTKMPTEMVERNPRPIPRSDLDRPKTAAETVAAGTTDTDSKLALERKRLLDQAAREVEREAERHRAALLANAEREVKEVKAAAEAEREALLANARAEADKLKDRLAEETRIEASRRAAEIVKAAEQEAQARAASAREQAFFQATAVPMAVHPAAPPAVTSASPDRSGYDFDRINGSWERI